MAGEWEFLICTSHRGAGTLNCSLSLSNRLTGTAWCYRHCLPSTGRLKKTKQKKSAVDILYNGTSQATRESPWREHPLFVRAERLALRTPSEAVWLTADPVHIPTHYLWRGAHWGRTVVPKRLIYKVYKWVTVTSINLRVESRRREGRGGGREE